MVAFVMKSASTQRRCDSAMGKNYNSISQMAVLWSSIALANDRKIKKKGKKEFPYLKQLQNWRSWRFWLDSDAYKSNKKEKSG